MVSVGVRSVIEPKFIMRSASLCGDLLDAEVLGIMVMTE